MKAKLIRRLGVACEDPAILAKLAHQIVDIDGQLFWKVGAVLEYPEAYRLVQDGSALPDDDECLIKSGMTPESFQVAVKRYERKARGIHPEEFDDFAAGDVTGYDAKGEPVHDPTVRKEIDATARAAKSFPKKTKRKRKK